MAKKITEIRETTEIINVQNLKEAVSKNSFVDLDHELVDQIQEMVDSVLQNHSHNEQTAKSSIEKWFNKMMLKNREFDIKTLRLTIRNQPAIYIQSQYHCETRQIFRVHEPFNGQVIPDKTEELWEKEPQNEFTETEIKWRRFGNNEIKNCYSCSATGIITCGDCRGKGEVWVTCGNCRGKGQIERTDAIVGRGGGKMAGGVVIRKEQCLRCSARGNILITCAKCNGGGRLVCGNCSGRKELFWYDNIQGNTSVISKELILSTFRNVKSKWIKNNKSSFNIQYKDNINGQNESRLKDLIPVNGKLLLENYNINIIPIAEVSFNFKGKDREIFIIDNEVFANETAYLHDKKKTIFTIGISILIVFILSLITFNWYSDNKLAKYNEQNQTALKICKETKQMLYNSNFEEASKNLSSIELESHFNQQTKDSINSTISTLLKTALENKKTYEVNSVCSKFSNVSFMNHENKNLLSDYNTLFFATNLINELEISRKTNRFEEIVNYDVSIDSILNLTLNYPNILDFLNSDSIAINSSKDFENYLKELLNFENTKDGIPCDIDDRLKKLETFISKIKSNKLIILLETTNNKLKKAQKKYENPC